MPAYQNTSGSSPIEWYEVTEDGAIEIRFTGQGRRRSRTYRYEGAVVTTLVELAEAGSGLATFIARHQPQHSQSW